MSPSPDVEELAAVVADGRPFDWDGVAETAEHRPLRALWRAVRKSEGDRASRVATRADLSTPLVWLSVLALLKAAVAAVVAGVAFNVVNAVQVAALASFTLVGAVLIYGGHRDLRARHLGVVLLLVGSVMTNPLLRQASEAWAGLPWPFDGLRGVVVESMLPAVMWLFAQGFPKTAWSPRDAKWLHRGLVWSTTLGVVLLVANGLYWAGVGLPGLWMFNRNSQGSSYFWPVVIASTISALIVMLRRRRDAEAHERARVSAFMAAIVGAISPTALIVIIGRTPLRPVLLSHFALTGAVMYSGLVVLPLATAYAVVAHQMFRVDLVLRSAARYALARGLLLTLSVAPLLMLMLHAYQNRQATVGELFGGRGGSSLLAMSAIGGLLLAFRGRVQRLVDRALRRDSVSLASALDLFARRSGEGLGLGDVADAVQRSLVAAFHPGVVAVLVADGARDAFVPVGATVAPLPRGTWLAQSLVGVRDPVVVDLEDAHGVARLLPQVDQDWLADSAVVVLTPLVASGGTLCGLVALGAMPNERHYTDGDLRYIGALAAAAAPAIESRLLRTAAGPGALDAVRWEDESGRECLVCGRTLAADANTCPDCGQPTVPMGMPVHLHGKFTVRRRLGAGGMGVAYLADDDALGRAVVLKTLPRVKPEAVEQLRREARAMARVSHPALATIHGLESWRSVPVLVVEYLPGGTLADRLRHGPMPEAEVIALARHVLSGLRQLHGAGLLHRDLKPSNIGFTADGAPKVLDFGLSRLRASAAVSSEMFGSAGGGVSRQLEAEPAMTSLAGTPAYMSPELVAGLAPSPADDLWALAVVMLEAVEGEHPWAALSATEVISRIRSAAVPWQRGETRRCSNELLAPLARMLTVRGNQRMRSADEFAHALATIVENSGESHGGERQ